VLVEVAVGDAALGDEPGGVTPLVLVDREEARLAEVVDPSAPLSVLDDEPDNRILECAVEADAEQIVTGDRPMLNLGQFRGIRIITLADYLA